MSDSEEENAGPSKEHHSKRINVVGSNSKLLLISDQYQQRLHRLREFQQQKEMLRKKKASQGAPFIPYVCSARIRDEVDCIRKDARALREVQLKPTDEALHKKRVSPSHTKFAKPRVDCWWTDGKRDAGKDVQRLAGGKEEAGKGADRFAQPITFVKPTKKAKETKNAIKPAKNRLNIENVVNHLARPQTKLITSTARKDKGKPLAFTFDPPSGLGGAKQKNTLTVADADSLFDGISPIDPIEDPTPHKKSVLPKSNHEGESIWEPQPVAGILEATAIDCETGVILINDDSPVVEKASERKAVLNESFTICDAPDRTIENAEDSIFGCRPIITDEQVSIVSDIKESSPLTVAAEKQDTQPREVSNKTVLTTNRRSSIWSVTLVSGVDVPSPSFENVPITGISPDEPKQIDTSASSRKRSSLAFTEENINTVISPSVSNLQSEPANSMANSKRRSSSSSSGPVVIQEGEAEEQPAVPPEEVLQKTNFYYQKVDSELARLQALCSEFAPFLEGEHELNDHCKGLIMAAQGQTNILINKKLTKFRDLIGHYKTKWNDRKVRNDDLDGFWLMVSLDLDNLDKRFAELRTLRENNWKESDPEPPPKEKKLQGAGVKKRAKKATVGSGGASKPSSSIAALIRKARQEQLKQKAANIDLGELAETVTLVKTPVRKSVRIAASPRRRSLQKRSSLGAGGTPTIIHWDHNPSPASRKRKTIFPETPKIADKRRAKSVLFLDSGLDTPQTRRRQSSRTVVDTPKPKIKFNEELEIEHIDNLVARTPSRLDQELQKRRRQSLLLFSATSSDLEKQDNGQRSNNNPCGTPKSFNSSKRRNGTSSRNLSAVFWNTEDDVFLEPDGKCRA
ncbi:hypothetical protein ZHAS_00002820 [Anopheles sinensis]|uniref:Disks large-associated protein 5 n=1 Tax=Anopheles sinensis TaxID=74873 RepID=A0A084VD25_ANOSI|nr:hypothetical protein ZHAS_00002820 [Anopheles sinensis]